MLYDLRLYDVYGNFLQSLNEFIELEFGRSKNSVGAASLLLSTNSYEISLFNPGNFLEIYRYNEFSNSYQLIDNCIWILTQITIETKDDGVETIELVFYDGIQILSYRVNPYFSIDPAVYTGIDYPSIFTDQPLDDMMKYFVFHNFTSGATNPLLNVQAPVTFVAASIPASVITANRITPLQIDPYLSFAPNGTYAGSWINVLTAIQDIAKLSESLGTNLWFDIFYIPNDYSFFNGAFTFKTFTNIRGNDLSQQIELSIENGGFSAAKLEINFADSANVIYAFGIENPDDSDGINEVLNVSAFDTVPFSPFGLKEKVLDLSGSADISNSLDLLEVQARVELQKSQAQYRLTGDIVQQGSLAFFQHYFYGDRIAVRYKNYTFEVDIEKYIVTVDAENEKIKIPVETSKLINFITITK